MSYLNLLLLVSLVVLGLTVDNGVGLTPPMGWNSWNHFGCDIDEELIKKTADRLVDLGLAKKGYVYLNLDDCWQISRDPQTTKIIEDNKKFPSGMPALSKYIHSKGLKFGLYSDAGQYTCQKRPGGYGHEKVDAQTYASWQVDYLKYDNCYHPNVSAKLRYYAMSKELNKTGRPIFFSLCNWGQENVPQWGSQYGNSWRTTGDISDSWKSFLNILEKQVGLEKYAGKGGWNDPDMLEVGNGKMTHNQYYAHFAFWCALKAPLLIGCDLNNITKQTLEILGNQQLIAINQDELGIQAKRVKSQITPLERRQVWSGPLSRQRYVVIFFNKGSNQASISVSLSKELGIQFDTYAQRDPIRHQDIALSNKDNISLKVPSHSVEVRVIQIFKNKLTVQSQ